MECHYNQFNFTTENSPSKASTGNDTVTDALGRSVNRYAGYVWTVTSVTATFTAAISSGYLPDCRLHGVIPTTSCGLHALIENLPTGMIGLYGLDPETARPFLVSECSPDRLPAMLRNLLLGRRTA
jgi:hypothetical protein